MSTLNFTGLGSSRSHKDKEPTAIRPRISYPLESRDHHPDWLGLDLKKLRQPKRVDPADDYLKAPHRSSDNYSLRTISAGKGAGGTSSGDVYFTVKPSRNRPR